MDFIEDEFESSFNEFFMRSTPYLLKQLYLHGSMDL